MRKMAKKLIGGGNKGQLETFGLVILIVLILVVVLIAARFLLVGDDEKIEVRKSVIANNMFNAILKANVRDCGQLREVLIECYESGGDEKDEECGCGLVEDVIADVLGSFELEEGDFELNAFVNNGQYFSVGECRNGVSASSYQARDGGNSYNFRFMLC